jgi:hypothetical protein
MTLACLDTQIGRVNGRDVCTATAPLIDAKHDLGATRARARDDQARDGKNGLRDGL